MSNTSDRQQFDQQLEAAANGWTYGRAAKAVVAPFTPEQEAEGFMAFLATSQGGKGVSQNAAAR